MRIGNVLIKYATYADVLYCGCIIYCIILYICGYIILWRYYIVDVLYYTYADILYYTYADALYCTDKLPLQYYYYYYFFVQLYKQRLLTLEKADRYLSIYVSYLSIYVL